MKRLLCLIAVLCIAAALAGCSAAPTWQELYWEEFRWHGLGSHVNLMDLNNDGILEMIITRGHDFQSVTVHGIFSITDGTMQRFINSRHREFFLLANGSNAYRHRETGEIRHFFVYETADVYRHRGIREVFLDWDELSGSDSLWEGFWASEYFIGVGGPAIYTFGFDTQPLSQEEFDNFFESFMNDWEQLPGLGLSLPGIEIQGETIDERRENFFAALDELAPDGLYVEPIPGLHPAAEPLTLEEVV